MANNKKLLEWIEKEEFTRYEQHDENSIILADNLRQAITNGELEPEVSGDVQRAINWFDDRKIISSPIDGSVKAYFQETATNEIFITIETALKQMRKVIPCEIAMDAQTGDWVQTCPDCNFTVQGSRRPARFCPNCGRPLKGGSK